MKEILQNEYSTLVKDLYMKAGVVGQPLGGTIELTDRCNLSCKMCYIRRDAEDASVRSQELPSETWLDVIKQAVDNGMIFLLLSGGEIFIRSDFFEIYTPITSFGLNLTLFTNATLITEETARQLSENPPNRIDVTLYGATQDIYESVTGVPGSYKRCCQGIEYLIKHQLPVQLKTTITKQNISEFLEMRQMATNWGVPFIAGWLVIRRRDGNSGNTKYRITAQESIYLSKLFYSESEKRLLSEPKDLSKNENKNLYCEAGRSSFVIDSSGRMNACLDLPLPATSVVDSGFKAAWLQLRQFADSLPKLSDVCLECEALDFCPRCPAWSWSETHSFNDPVPYLCEIARLTRMSAIKK